MATTSAIRSPTTITEVMRPPPPRSAPASAALRSTSRTFARRLAPPVCSWKRASRNGVTSRPRIPSRAGGRQRLGEHALVQLRVELLVERVGDDQRAVDPQLLARPQRRGHLGRRVEPPRRGVARSRRGRSPGSDRCRSRPPPTPSVSSRSSVAGTSRIDFTPEHTTQIAVRESATRSADSSHVSCASRCTPPSPPVANTRMPARAATCAVAATVVAPLAPRAAASGRSRALSLATSSREATASSCASESPTRTVPSSSAIVAGTAPCSRTAASISRAIRALSGRGRPWAMIVDSSATTAPPRRQRRRDLVRQLHRRSVAVTGAARAIRARA